MRKIFSLFAMAMLVISVMPVVFGQVSVGTGVEITPEDIVPRIWSCADRVVTDDNLAPGRSTGVGDLTDRVNNYAFEGEQISWTVLVMNENGITEITDVVGTVDTDQGTGGDVEVSCVEVVGIPGGLGPVVPGGDLPQACNARIDGLVLEDFDSTTQRFYECTLTVEDGVTQFGEYYATIEATDGTQSAIVDENEFWFLNPIIALSLDGGSDGNGLLTFAGVRPGTVSYSDTVIVGNDAEADSGVMLDMFVSGTDFFDPVASGISCPVSNRLRLGDNFAESGDADEATPADLDDDCDINLGSTEIEDQFCYYASSGAYDTENDPRADAEGYVPIVYGDSFSTDFYNDAEIIGGPGSELIDLGGTDYYAGNVLAPGAEIAMTFKLGLPLPCTGDFSDGDIYFWGEPI